MKVSAVLILDNTMASPLFPALFSLNMLIGTVKGQAYSEAALRNMLEKRNISDIQRLNISSLNDAGIIWGVKP